MIWAILVLILVGRSWLVDLGDLSLVILVILEW